MGDLLSFPSHPAREPWMTKRELVRHLGVSERSIERWMKEGLPSERFGTSRRFRASAVEEWLSRRSA